MRIRKVFIIIFLIVFAPNTFSVEMKNSRGDDYNTSFKVFDATLYTNKPDMTKYGILPLPDVARFWKKGESKDNLPSEYRIKKLARRNLFASKYAFINIEHWPLRGEVQDVYMNISKYKTAIKWVKEAVPNTKIGLYSMFPTRDYWRAIKDPFSTKYKAWQRENDLLTVLAHSDVDIIYPSLYTFYPDQLGWVKYAKANISEARRYGTGKPVYVFLWPQYHDSNRLLRLKYLEEDYWRLQLETAYKYADGLVIWGGSKEDWNDEYSWWQVTKEFIKEVGIDEESKE